MLVPLDFFRTKLQQNFQVTDNKIDVPLSVVKVLNEKMSGGDHTYMTVRYLDRTEVLKITKTEQPFKTPLQVERDYLGTGRKNFPCGSCVSFEWTADTIREFVCGLECVQPKAEPKIQVTNAFADVNLYKAHPQEG